MSEEVEVKADPAVLLKKTLRNLLLALIAMVLGYIDIVVMMKTQLQNELMANLGVLLFVIGYGTYIFLSQQLAVAFERNKGLNFLMVTFFPIGTVANYLMYKKKINELLENK